MYRIKENNRKEKHNNVCVVYGGWKSRRSVNIIVRGPGESVLQHAWETGSCLELRSFCPTLPDSNLF